MNIGVVTSCHNYGRYLADWAASIVAQRVKPRMAVLVDNGSTDGTPQQIAAAAAALEAAGVRTVTRRIDRCNFGRARNAAVELADTEWVMHFDCDDELLPHALEDAKRIAPRADVIAFGYERSGDLAAGPQNRTRVYSDTCGLDTLQCMAPASGLSPFRRRFWEKRPYPEDMIGGWDTALWLGFAWLGARFVATRRPVFKYRQHADSIFNKRRKDKADEAVVAARLMALRRPGNRVSVLVPRGPDGGARDASWAWVRRRYEALYPDWEIVEGHCPGEWRKGVAVNDAAARASGDVFIIADSDCVLPRAALEEAVAKLRAGAPWVLPHGLVHRLGERATATIIAGDATAERFDGAVIRRPYRGYAGGGFVVVSRLAFASVGGFPTGFAGWGAEDEALAYILDTMLGPHIRLRHDLWHLWHPPGPRAQDPHYARNVQLCRLYRAAKGRKPAMRSLLRLPAAPTPPGTVRMLAIATHLVPGRPRRPAGAVFVCAEGEARDRERQKVAVRIPDGQLRSA